MSKIAILTDSAGNVSENIEKGIFVVPLYVNFPSESKKDMIEISGEEVLARLDSEMPKTSAPSIDDFAEKILQIKSLGYEKIIGIAISSGLSATMNSMKIALEEDGIESKIIDTKQVSYSEGFLTVYAQKMISEGKEFEQIVLELERIKSGAKLYGMVTDLKYLVKGGRVKPLKGFVGSLLKINPLLHIIDGVIEPHSSVRGKAKALKKFREVLEEDLKDAKEYYFSVLYATDEVKDELKEEVKNLIINSAIYVEERITSVLTTHTGPSVQAVAYLKIR